MLSIKSQPTSFCSDIKQFVLLKSKISKSGHYHYSHGVFRPRATAVDTLLGLRWPPSASAMISALFFIFSSLSQRIVWSRKNRYQLLLVKNTWYTLSCKLQRKPNMKWKVKQNEVTTYNYDLIPYSINKVKGSQCCYQVTWCHLSSHNRSQSIKSPYVLVQLG